MSYLLRNSLYLGSYIEHTWRSPLANVRHQILAATHRRYTKEYYLNILTGCVLAEGDRAFRPPAHVIEAAAARNGTTTWGLAADTPEVQWNVTYGMVMVVVAAVVEIWLSDIPVNQKLVNQLP